MLLILLTTTAVLDTVTSQVLIDLSKATLDEETGNFCVVQKVCQSFLHLYPNIGLMNPTCFFKLHIFDKTIQKF